MKYTNVLQKSLYSGIIFFSLSISKANSQTFFIKETFSGASDSTAPSGWQSRRVSGGTAAGFRFDNRTNLLTTYPMQAPFASFDAPTSIYEGSSQVVALESPELDLTGRDKLLLSYDHQYTAGTDASGKVQVLANNVWTDVEVYTQTTAGSPSVVMDVSSLMAGLKNVKVRFLWTGKNSGNWAIDNVKLFAPSGLDAGIVSIDAPVSPFGEGQSPIEVSLFNYGGNTITGTRIRWSVNGNLQPEYAWSGSLDFAKKKSGIRIGTVDMRAGASYLLKVWTEDPNGQLDGNPSNDTTIRTLIPSLCGIYTIGGSNPNFPTISRAAEYLHNAGVGCPVVFKIRDGQYVEQPEFRAIRGTSAINTVTFESESGDSSKVRLFTRHDISSYPYTLSINGSKHLRFRKMSLAKQGTYWDYNILEIGGDSYDIKIENCFFDAQLSSGIIFKNQADSIIIRNNLFKGNVGGTNITSYGINIQSVKFCNVTNNYFTGFSGYGLFGYGEDALFEKNIVDKIPYGAHFGNTGKVYIQDNIFRNVKSGLQLFGNGKYTVQRNKIGIINGTGIDAYNYNSIIINNWIYDSYNTDQSTSIGLRINNSSNFKIQHNTIHIFKGGVSSRALEIGNSFNIDITNNILSIKKYGLPISVYNVFSGIKSHNNNIYNPEGFIGEWNGRIYDNLTNWRNGNKIDSNSISVNSFFKSDSILIPNNMLINNRGKFLADIKDDIDQTARDNDSLDIGAKEINPCQTDAGVGAVLSPTNPLNGGKQDVVIQLINHGIDTLKSARIGWKNNNDTTSYFDWTGSIAPLSSSEIKVGELDIKASTAYQIKSWTSNPNGKSDCNNYNDTSFSNVLFSRLCGTYTIGGTNPDFSTISEAVEFLNKAGVSCKTTFLIRNGTYNEVVSIDSIPGTSRENTVTFTSESGDSTLVQISTNVNKHPSAYTFRLNGTRFIRIIGLSISKTGTNGSYHALEISGNSYDIKINNCRLNPLAASGIVIKDKADSVEISKNFLTGSMSGNSNTSGDGIYLATEGSLIIDSNFITSFYYNGINGNTIGTIIKRNRIEKVRSGASLVSYNQSSFIQNSIQSNGQALTLYGSGHRIENNKIEFRNNHGISANIRNSVVANNWIRNSDNQDQKTNAGIELNECEEVRILYNTVFLKVSESNTNVISVNKGKNISWYNNTFSLRNLGKPISISNSPTGIKADKNNYHSPYRVLGAINGKSINDLNSWKTETLLDSNSLSVNPFFEKDTILTPGHILLNGSAKPMTDIKQDIDFSSRDTSKPDIGAKEFSPCTDDAGISEIISPVNPIGKERQVIKVRLFNHGTNTLNSVAIGWRLNQEPITSFNWTGSLASGKYEDIILDSILLNSITPNYIQSWTTLPNQQTDCKNYNDTSMSTPLYGKLCGTYTIGGSSPSFNSVKAAVEVLNLAGVSCPVKFLIRNGTYQEQIVLDSINGASPVNTITFESESGDSSKVQITSNNAVSLDPFTFNLNGSRHVRFNKIAIGKQGGYWDFHAVEISSDAKDIILSNCLINPRYATGVIIKDSADLVVIKNCMITGDNSGLLYARLDGIRMNSKGAVYIYDNVITGLQSSGINTSTGKVFASRNKISSSFTGIELNSIDTTLISANEITKVKDGIMLGNSAKYHIDANRIRFSTGTGILLNNTSFARISNNWISNLENISTNGIAMRNASNTSLLFNAINITGTNNNSSAIDILNGTKNNIFNNIIKNASGGYCMKINNGGDNLLTDYNCYYAPLNNIGVLNDKLYNELDLWGAALKGDAASIFVNPFFRNNDDVKPNHILVNDAGIRYNPITHDIDSTLRNPVSPDMGAKEFVPCDVDAGINEFTSPSLSLATGKQDIKVVLQNQGLLSLNSVRIHWSLNGAMQPAFDWIGTLPSRKNVEVNIGNFEFTSGPEWIVKAWTSIPNGTNDCNNYNDTTVLRLPGTSNGVPAPPTVRDTTICQGNSVTLKAKGVGRIGWYTAAKGGTWLGGDSLFITPPLQSTTIYYVQDSVMAASLARTAVTVTVFAKPTFDPFPTKIYSKANDLTLAIDTTIRPKTITWNTGNSTISQLVKYTGSYNVTVFTEAGCRLADTVFVQFPDTAHLKVGLVNGSCSEPVEVPVSVQNFRRISRFMGELTWDISRLRFDSIRIYAEPGMKASDFTTTITSTGRLRFQWSTNDTSWKSLPDSTVIFTVRLIPITSQFATWPVSLNTDPARFAFYDDRPVSLKTMATNGGVNVNTCLMNLEGKVLTPLDEGVINVQMTLSGPDAKQTLTRQDGSYALSANKGVYTLTPYKNNERQKLNGVSTLDIALIQSHLLFRQRLANPYKIIAADANNSGSITTADILSLRRILLQMDTSLPGNRTWAFVDATQTFPNPEMPFPFNATKAFNDQFGKVTHTFRAIKLGDVNYDRDPRLDQSIGRDTLNLTAEIKELPGLRYRMIVKTNAIKDVMGFQGTLSWDNTALNLHQVNANPLDMGVGETATKDGKLLFSWNDPKAIGVSFNKGTTLLDITLQAKNSQAKPTLSLTDDILAREAFNASFQKINMKLDMPELLNDETGIGALRLYPNPVKNNVTADWRSTQTGTAMLKLLDPGGRTVWSMTVKQTEGLNRQSIGIPKGIANGNYILRLESNDIRASGTLVIQR